MFLRMQRKNGMKNIELATGNIGNYKLQNGYITISNFNFRSKIPFALLLLHKFILKIY